MKKRNKINTGKSKIGAFTRAAKKAGMSEQEFAKKVLANKHNYSSAMVKKANFAANAAKWKKQIGGDLFTEDSNKVNYIPSIYTLIHDPNWKKRYIGNMVNKYNTSESKNVKPSKINLKLKPKEKRPSKFKTKFNLNTSKNKVDHPLWGKYKKVSRPSGFTTSFNYDPNDALSITGKIDPKLKNKEINPNIQLKGKYKNILDVGYNTDFKNSNLNLGLNNKYINAKFNTDFKGANRLALKGKYKKLFGADFDTDFEKSYNIGVKAGPFSGKFSNADNAKNLELSLKHKNIGIKFDTDLQNRQRFNVSGEKKLGPIKLKGNYNISSDKNKLDHNLNLEGDIKFSPKFSLSPSLVSDITNQKNKLGLSAKISPNKNIILTPKISWSPDQYSVGTGINWKPNKMLNIGADVNYGNEGFGGNVFLKTALNNTKKELPKHQDGRNIKERILKEYPGFKNILNKTKYYKTDILDSSKTGFGDTETIFPNLDTVKYSNYKTGLKDLPNPNYNTDNYTVAYNPKNINLNESTIPLASELFHISNLDPVLKSLRQDIINAAYESDPYFKKDVKERIKKYPEYTKKEQEEIVSDGYMRNILYNSLLENTGKDYILKNNRYHPEEAKDISGFYQPMSNQIINYLQNPQGYPLPQVNVTAKRINKQKGGLVKYQKGKNIGGVERYNSILNKFDNKGWSSLSKDEQQFYKDNYKTTIPNKFTLDENNTLYGTLPTVSVTAPYYKGPGEDITREGVTDTIVSGGKALAKELYDYTGLPAIKRIYNDPWSYANAVKGFGKAVVNRAISPFPYHVPTPEEMVVGDKMGDLLEVTPGVGLLGKGAKTAGRVLTTGPLKNTYKYNPFSNKLNEYNRIVAQDAVQDAMQTNLIRTGKPKDYKKGPGINLDRRGFTPYPSFGKKSKGLGNLEAYYNNILKRGNTPYIISTDRPMKVSTLGRHGQGSTMFPVDESGNYLKQFPLSEADIYNYQPHWLKGYQKVKQKGGLVKYQDGKYIPVDYSIFKPINYSNSESTRVEKPIQMTLSEKDNLRKLEEEKKLEEIGRVAKLNRENKFRHSVGQEKTPLNTLVAGLQGPGTVYAAGLQGIKKLTGSDGGADWSKVQPDFYGIRNNPAYEGQDYSLSKAINDKWAKENPGFAGLIDIGVPLVGGVGWNKAAKLVDNTLDFANSAKGQLNRNLSDFSKETIKEVKPNVNRFENIIHTNPISQGNARNLVEQGRIDEIYDSFKEGANTIDEFKKNYLKDLTSDEGIKRLINQEADYLRSIGIPESEIAKRAETAAFARINEIKDIKNLNRKFSQGKSELSGIIDNSSNFNNAYYRSANRQEILDDVLSNDLINNTGGISLKKNKRIGEKSYPGSTLLGTTYSKNIPTAAHEIGGHGLQAGRKLPLDDRLRKLDVDLNTLNEYELAAYNYYKKGSKRKEPSAFLHGLREAMLQAGLIKSRYEYISPKKIKMAKTYFDRRPSGIVNDNDFSFNSNTRILDFAKPTESNFKLLAEEINKLPLTIPAIGTAGLLNQQQYKKGGQVKKDLKGTYTSSAQRLMDDNDLDPSYITASNENGRIYKGDVSKALKSLNNYGAGFPNALDYKKVGVLPKNKIKYSKNTLIGPVGMPPYRWKSYKTPIFNHGGQIPHQGTKVFMKMLDKNDMLPPNDSDKLSYRDRPVGMSLTMSKTIKSPIQVIQYDDGGNIARTEDEFKEGLNAGKNVFPFGQKGLKKMTSTPPSGDMEVPINMKGFTDGEQTDEQVMLPGEDVNVDGDTIVETPDLSSMDLNKAFDYANSKKFPIFMWKGNEYKLKRHLKKKQRGGLFSNKVTDHVKLNPGFSPDVK